MDVITLKLDFGTLAPEVHAQYFVIGAEDDRLIDESEFADFSIDCNLAGTTSAIAAGGIKVFGSHIRIRRIRVKNFGTRTVSRKGAAISTAGAFPDNPEPFDCVVEDCIIDEPYANSVRETAWIELAGGEDDDGLMGNHKGCVVRNCLINCMYIDREFSLYEVTFSSPKATATTKAGLEHGRSGGDWVVVTGAIINSSTVNAFNGTWPIDLVVPFRGCPGRS